MLHGLSCSTSFEIFQNQGSNPCLLHWQGDSFPLSYQANSEITFLIYFIFLIFRVLPVALLSFWFCVMETNFTRSALSWIKVLAVLLGEACCSCCCYCCQESKMKSPEDQDESAPYSHDCLLENSVSCIANEEKIPVWLTPKPDLGILWYILPNSKVSSTGHLPWVFFISQTRK